MYSRLSLLLLIGAWYAPVGLGCSDGNCFHNKDGQGRERIPSVAQTRQYSPRHLASKKYRQVGGSSKGLLQIAVADANNQPATYCSGATVFKEPFGNAAIGGVRYCQFGSQALANCFPPDSQLGSVRVGTGTSNIALPKSRVTVIRNSLENQGHNYAMMFFVAACDQIPDSQVLSLAPVHKMGVVTALIDESLTAASGAIAGKLMREASGGYWKVATQQGQYDQKALGSPILNKSGQLIGIVNGGDGSGFTFNPYSVPWMTKVITQVRHALRSRFNPNYDPTQPQKTDILAKKTPSQQRLDGIACQGQTPWCWAFTTAELLQQMGKMVSGVDVVRTWFNGRTPFVGGVPRMMVGAMRKLGHLGKYLPGPFRRDTLTKFLNASKAGVIMFVPRHVMVIQRVTPDGRFVVSDSGRRGRGGKGSNYVMTYEQLRRTGWHGTIFMKRDEDVLKEASPVL